MSKNRILTDEQVQDLKNSKPETKIAPETAQRVIPAAVVKDNQNYWPIEDLPSRGLLYPEGTRLYGRPLSVLEVKKLSSMTSDNADFIINETLTRCIKTEGITIDDILVSDKAYLLYWLRANTYRNSGFMINFVCPHCEREAEYKFGLDILDTRYFEKEKMDLGECSLPESQKQIRLKHLSIKDETLIKNLIKSYSKSTIIKIDTDLAYTCAQIDYVEGLEFRSLKDKYDFLINCHPSDYSFIESYSSYISFGVSPFIEATCSHEGCGLTSEQQIFFRPEFFIPEHKFR